MEIKFRVEKKQDKRLFYGCYAVCCKKTNTGSKGIL